MLSNQKKQEVLMEDASIKNSGQGQLFNNPLLEYLTKAPPQISASTYITIAAGLLYVASINDAASSASQAILIFVGALFFWTFFEYIFHRHINHIDEHFPESEWAEKMAYTLHGIHHEYPRDKERLIMPPVPGLLIVGLFYIVFRTALGEYVYLFMPGFMAGYLLYTHVHFSIHKRKVPSYFKTQYRHHALHHYKYPEKAFGVSVTLWDRVFGTMPPEE